MATKREKEIKKAMDTLRKYGYAIDSVLEIEEVTDKYECTDEEAHTLLERVMSDQSTRDHLTDMIPAVADLMGLNEKEDEDGNND